jgi:hypothetical protein
VNRSISLHPLSALVGAILALSILISMGQSLASTVFRVEYLPHPKDMVQVKEGAPFVVPAGRVLVVTALGSVGINATNATLRINGVDETSVNPAGNGQAAHQTMMELPTCFSAQAGTTVSVVGSYGDGRVWGYLASL